MATLDSKSGSIHNGSPRTNVVYNLISKKTSTLTAIGIILSILQGGMANAASFQGLGDLPGGIFSSEAKAISLDGLSVVGTSVSANGPEAFRWTKPTGIIGLGDLPGDPFSSIANGVSGDGSVVVGFGSVNNDLDTSFRWTEAEGIMELRNLPPGSFNGTSLAVSADGSVIVGTSSAANGIDTDAFVWDTVNGLRNLQEVLSNDFGLNLTDWHLSSARGISADGTTIIGNGINPNGQGEGWIAQLNGSSPPTVPSALPIPEGDNVVCLAFLAGGYILKRAISQSLKR